MAVFTLQKLLLLLCPYSQFGLVALRCGTSDERYMQSATLGGRRSPQGRGRPCEIGREEQGEGGSKGIKEHRVVSGEGFGWGIALGVGKGLGGGEIRGSLYKGLG